MTFRTQLILARVIAITIAVIGFVQLGDQEILGVSPRLAAWLTIVSAGLGVALGFLPSVRGTAREIRDAERAEELKRQFPNGATDP